MPYTPGIFDLNAKVSAKSVTSKVPGEFLVVEGQPANPMNETNNEHRDDVSASLNHYYLKEAVNQAKFAKTEQAEFMRTLQMMEKEDVPV